MRKKRKGERVSDGRDRDEGRIGKARRKEDATTNLQMF